MQLLIFYKKKYTDIDYKTTTKCNYHYSITVYCLNKTFITFYYHRLITNNTWHCMDDASVVEHLIPEAVALPRGRSAILGNIRHSGGPQVGVIYNTITRDE